MEGDNETALKCILQAAADLEYVIEEEEDSSAGWRQQSPAHFSMNKTNTYFDGQIRVTVTPHEMRMSHWAYAPKVEEVSTVVDP